MKTILSIDGGGVRGIIPAVLLSFIEKKLNKPLNQAFDLMVGTSTGAILAAGLNTIIKPSQNECQPTTANNTHKPANRYYTAENLLDFYQVCCPKIFSQSFVEKVKTGLGFFSSSYDHRLIEKLLKRYLRDTQFNQVHSQLLIPCFDIHNNDVLHFDSSNPSHAKIPLHCAVRAATAAPTYFEPYKIHISHRPHYLIDGAIYVNNPAMAALAHAKKIFPNETIFMLSIGTGQHRKIPNLHKASDWGKTEWIRPLLRSMCVGSVENTHQQLEIFLGNQYIRLQPILESGCDKLDNASPENLENLSHDATHFIKHNQDVLNHVIDKLNQHIAQRDK